MAALAVLLPLCSLPDASAQDQPAATQGTSRGENFSAKPPAQLFATDCTGAGCHKGPQGLGRGQFPGSLASFLREHYTNSRESAAALAGYLSNISRGPDSREARTPRPGKPTAAAPAPPSSLPHWGEGAGVNERRPAPHEARAQRGRPSATAAAPPPSPPEPEAAAAPPPPPKQYDIFD